MVALKLHFCFFAKARSRERKERGITSPTRSGFEYILGRPGFAIGFSSRAHFPARIITTFERNDSYYFH